MQKISFIFLFFFLSLGAVNAQKMERSLEKRTYPIDSCLWFHITFDFEVRGARTFGNGNAAVTISFSSSSPEGSLHFGNGRFLVDSALFPLQNWSWQKGQKGRMQLIIPNNAQGEGSQDPTGESNFTSFPMLTPGFILEVEGNKLSPIFEVNFQLQQLESEM